MNFIFDKSQEKDRDTGELVIGAKEFGDVIEAYDDWNLVKRLD